MKGYFLDTDVLIDWLRGKEKSATWMREKIEAGVRLFISGRGSNRNTADTR